MPLDAYVAEVRSILVEPIGIRRLENNLIKIYSFVIKFYIWFT